MYCIVAGSWYGDRRSPLGPEMDRFCEWLQERGYSPSAKQKGQGIQCLNNLRQLGLAWTMYADDFQDRVVLNGDPQSPQLAWVNGNLDHRPNNSQNTNISLITRALLFPFVGAVGPYKYPGDRSTAQFMGAIHPRVRTASINGWIGTRGQQLDAWTQDTLGAGRRSRPDLADR